jgi:hypothetical protein
MSTLTEDRIREVLAALPTIASGEAKDPALAQDIARLLEVHGFVTVGLDVARRVASASDTAEARELAERLATVTSEEEAAVKRMHAEIGTALSGLRA